MNKHFEIRLQEKEWLLKKKEEVILSKKELIEKMESLLDEAHEQIQTQQERLIELTELISILTSGVIKHPSDELKEQVEIVETDISHNERHFDIRAKPPEEPKGE